MKLFPLLSLLFGISVVFAQEVSAPATGLDWNNLGALGVLSVVVCYLLMRAIPKMQEEHREDRKAFREALDTICDHHEESHAKMAEALQQLQVHCAEQNKAKH